MGITVQEGTAEQKEAAGKELFAAFRDVGFVYLKNHGIPQEKLDTVFTTVRIAPTLNIWFDRAGCVNYK
jgi:isopenicillin N synthase-like dioxygenase